MGEAPEIFIKLGAPMAQEKLSERTLFVVKCWQNGSILRHFESNLEIEIGIKLFIRDKALPGASPRNFFEN